MKREVICYHPELRPTDWEQKKPLPSRIETCDCGTNWCCPVCGFGEGCYPCDCTKKIVEKTPIDREAKWLGDSFLRNNLGEKL